jgi:hypothetical protein
MQIISLFFAQRAATLFCLRKSPTAAAKNHDKEIRRVIGLFSSSMLIISRALMIRGYWFEG